MLIKYLNTAPFTSAPDGAGGTPPAAGTPPAETPLAAGVPVVPPWGPDVNTTWMTGDKPWYETLIPDGPTKDLFRDKKYANPAVAADAYYSANKMINNGVVALPGADAKPEDWTALHVKLGRPEAADKYDIRIDPAVKVDPNMLKFGKDLAFELGLPPAFAQKMVDKWNGFAAQANSATVTQQQTENTQQLDGVKQTWGDQFETKLNNGKNAVKVLYDLTKPAEQALYNKIEGAIGSAAMLDLFARIGGKTGEGPMIGGGSVPPDNPDNMTAAQAQAEITRLRADPAFSTMLNTRNDPGHAAAVAKMERLHVRLTAKAA